LAKSLQDNNLRSQFLRRVERGQYWGGAAATALPEDENMRKRPNRTIKDNLGQGDLAKKPEKDS
jgi:hypothetical protein